MRYDEYQMAMSNPQQANACIAQQMATHPELFPAAMSAGYKLHGWTAVSKKMPDVRLRRIRLQTANDAGQKLTYTIAPCDLLPYMTGTVTEVEKALFFVG